MLRKLVPYILLVLCLSCVISCKQDPSRPWIGTYFENRAPGELPSLVQYAQGFDIYHWDGITKLVIYHPTNSGLPGGEYYLANSEVTGRFRDTAHMITLPLRDVAVFSSTQLSAFIKLGELEKVKGISEAGYITDPDVRKLLQKGSINELAGSGHFFIEKTLEVNPGLIFISPYNLEEQHALELTGIPLIPFFDFFETDPLGRAEWIRFTAAFCGKEEQADSIFGRTVDNYKSYAQLAGQVIEKPTVFSDKYFNGQWFIPGGQSYIARLFADAGADYLWKEDTHKASFPLDYESVFERAHDADFWRIIGSYGDVATYESLAAENELYRHFKAFRERKVIYCDAEQTAYFENSPLEPDVVLADLIRAFHPELLPDYKPKYYHRLP
ncbi:MAG: ABC transporter substrate-binding protein [bacterium]